MKTILSVIALILCLGVAGNGVAGLSSYHCEVIHVYTLADNATLETSSWEKEFKGSKFSISRATGDIIGEVLPTLLAKSVKVIHQGSDQYYFKSVADFENQVQTIEVKEFKEDRHKPFAAMSLGGAGIVTGVCE